MRKLYMMEKSLLNRGKGVLMKRYLMRRRLASNAALATVEIVILIAIAILLLALFKDQAMALVSKVWAAINKGAGGIVQ